MFNRFLANGSPINVRFSQCLQLLQYVREVAQKVIDVDPNGILPENEILWRQLKALRKTNVNWAAIS